MTRRRYLWGLALLLLIALVVCMRFLLDDAWLERQAESAVTDALQRQFTIESLSIDWGVQTTVVAQSVTLANPDWADSDHFVTIDDIEVSFDLPELFLGHLELQSVRAGKLGVWLELNPDGIGNWRFEATQKTGAKHATPPDWTRLALTELRLDAAYVAFLSAQRPDPLVLEVNGMQARAFADDGLELALQGEIDQRPVQLDGSLQPFTALLSGAASDHRLTLSVGPASLTSRGHLESTHGLSGADLELRLSGQAFAQEWAPFGVPAVAQGAYELNLDVSTRGGTTRGSLQGSASDLAVSAEFSTDGFSASASGAVKAQIQGANWTDVAHPLGLPGRIVGPFRVDLEADRSNQLTTIRQLSFSAGEHSATAQGRLGDWPDLHDSMLELAFSGPDLSLWVDSAADMEVLDQPFTLNLSLDRTGAQPPGIEALLSLPDESIRLDGRLGTLPGLDGADLRFRGDGAANGALTRLLGFRNPTDKPLEMTAHVSRTGALIRIDRGEIRLGGHELAVDGQIGPFPSMDSTRLDFNLQGPDVSDWGTLTGRKDLPPRPYLVRGALTPEGELLRLESTEVQVGANRIVAEGLIGDFPLFAGTDIEWRIDGADLSDFRALPGLGEAPALAFGAHGRVVAENRGLRFEGVDVSVGGSRLEMAGMLVTHEGPGGSEFTVGLHVPSLSEMGQVFGVDGLPPAAFSIVGSLRASGDSWSFQVDDGRLDEARFETEGTFARAATGIDISTQSHVRGDSLASLGASLGVVLPDRPYELRGSAEYRNSLLVARALHATVGSSRLGANLRIVPERGFNGSELNIEASGADFAEWLPNPGTGDHLPFQFRAHLVRAHNETRVQAFEGRLGQIEATVVGKLSDPHTRGETDLAIRVTAPSLAQVGERTAIPLPDQALDFTAHFKGSPDRFTTERLELSLGPSRVTGFLTVDLRAKPQLSGHLRSPNLDLTWLDTGERPDSAPADAPTKDGFLIPDTPLPELRVDFLDALLDVDARLIRLPNLTLHDLGAHLQLKDATITLDPFRFRVRRGDALEGRLVIRHDLGHPAIDLTVHGENLMLGLAPETAEDAPQMQRGRVDAVLNGNGATWHELAASLDGYMLLELGPGWSVNRGLSLFFGDFIGELAALLNPFSKQEEYTQNVCDVLFAASDSGRVSLGPWVSLTDKILITGQGTIDLNKEALNLTFNTSPRKGIGLSAGMLLNPFLAVYGTLQKPLIGLDPAGVAVQGSVAVATAGLSLLLKGLSDRFLGSKDPCGDAMREARKRVEDRKAAPAGQPD